MAELSVLEDARNKRARDRYAGTAERVGMRCGGLVVMYDPLEFYVGRRNIPLAPLEGAILELLVRQGRASSQALVELFERENASIKALNVHLHRLRRKFLEAGLFDPIETVRGWGLKLSIDREDVQYFPTASGF